MPDMKLSYFDLRGRAEPIRLAFIIGGIDFEDDRFPFSSWKDIKPTTPYGSVPTLSIEGEVMAQSNAIFRYVGKLSKLYPTCPLAALKVDEVIDTLVDLFTTLYAYKGDDQEKLKEARKNFVTEAVPRYAGALEKRLDLFGEGVYAVDGELSLADIAITCFINGIKCGVYDFVGTDVMDDFPKLMAIHKTVMEIPSVAEFYKKYPIKYQTPKME